VNADRQFVELCVHGWEWGVHTFHSEMPEWNPVDDVLALSNADSLPFSLPFWMVYSCSSGAYDAVLGTKSDCLGERLMHGNGMNGAIGYFGASEASGNAWEHLGTYLWEAFFEQHLHMVGDAIAYAKLKHFSVTADRSSVLMYNLLGDPALNVLMTDVGYGDLPDYVVNPDDLRTSPAFPAASGSTHFEAVVHNRSNCNPEDDVAVEFVLCERDGSNCDTLDIQWVRPTAWSADTARVAWNAGSQAAVGHRILRVTVDPDDEQTELIEDNNDAETHVGSYFAERSGFPVRVGGLVGFSPIVTEIDNDTSDGPEVVAATRDGGRVGVYSCADGDSLWRFAVPESLAVRGSPAVADLDADGSVEIIVCYGDSVVARHADASPAWSYHAENLFSGPAVGDFVDGDGRLETVVTRGTESDLRIVFISCDGETLREQAFAQMEPPVGGGLDPCPVAADLDGDGLVDAAVAYRRGGILGSSALSATDGNGGWNETFLLAGDPADVAPCNAAVGDVDSSSAGLEVLVGTRKLDCVGTVAGTPTLKWRSDIPGYLAGVSLADLGVDGTLEVVAAVHGVPGDPDSIAGAVRVFASDGSTVDSFSLEYGCTSQPVIADLDGNGEPELVVSSTRPWFVPPYGDRWLSHLDILTLTGGELERFIERPLFLRGELVSTPTVEDTDGDGGMEIWLVDGEGYLHCLEYEGQGAASRWSCYQHDERHTGVYETPVSGQYPPNTTASWWGDCYMTGDVSVDSTSTLVIQPGTTVWVATSDDQEGGADEERVELIAQCGWPRGGALTVGGDPLRPVVLTSAAESPQPGDWVGIRSRPRSTVVVENAVVSHADDAVYAHKPDALRVLDSTVDDADTRGVRCRSHPDSTDQVLISGNSITVGNAGLAGIDLTDCRAVVESNTLDYGENYGARIVDDRGTLFRGNRVISPPTWYDKFSALYVDDPMGALVIEGNTFGEQYFGIPYMGIRYECTGSTTDSTVIKGNTIFLRADGDTGTGFGMYVYDGSPTVRANTITGKTFQAAFYVDGTTGRVPCLGDTAAGDCCSNTTLAGCNRIVPEDPPAWYVYATSAIQDTVKAECNYWSPAPDSSYFHGLVDWNPSLKGDPEGRGGSWEETGEDPVALTLELLPNTPNPFNPETAFRFAVPQATQVKLEVYDLAGRHVRTLVDGLVQAGWQTARWDGRSDGGARVASGVYFCRLEAGTRELSRKVVVLK
jgi:hypothetical protein